MFFFSSPSLYIAPTPILNNTHPDNRSVASQRACYCIRISNIFNVRVGWEWWVGLEGMEVGKYEFSAFPPVCFKSPNESHMSSLTVPPMLIATVIESIDCKLCLYMNTFKHLLQYITSSTPLKCTCIYMLKMLTVLLMQIFCPCGFHSSLQT